MSSQVGPAAAPGGEFGPAPGGEFPGGPAAPGGEFPGGPAAPGGEFPGGPAPGGEFPGGPAAPGGEFPGGPAPRRRVDQVSSQVDQYSLSNSAMVSSQVEPAPAAPVQVS